MTDGKPRIALLIDADNAPAAKTRRHLGKCCAAWLRQRPARVRELEVLQQGLGGKAAGARDSSDAAVPYCTGKNASDIAMVVDAMDLLHDGSVDDASRSCRVTLTSRRWRCAWCQAARRFMASANPTRPKRSSMPARRSPRSASQRSLRPSRARLPAVRDEKKLRDDNELHDVLRRAVTAATGARAGPICRRWARRSRTRLVRSAQLRIREAESPHGGD